MSTKPDDFGLDLATRIALHEILLEKLLLENLLERPHPRASLETIRESLLRSFDESALTADGAPLDDGQREWIRQQSLYGKELSNRFVEKVARLL